MEMGLDKLYCSKEWLVRRRDYSVLNAIFGTRKKLVKYKYSLITL